MLMRWHRLAKKQSENVNLGRQKPNEQKKTRVRQPVDVPVDVGLGPSFLQVSGPVQDQQNWHYGVKLSLAAVIDQALIESQKHRVPKKYRKHVKKVGERSDFDPDRLRWYPMRSLFHRQPIQTVVSTAQTGVS